MDYTVNTPRFYQVIFHKKKKKKKKKNRIFFIRCYSTAVVKYIALEPFAIPFDPSVYCLKPFLLPCVCVAVGFYDAYDRLYPLVVHVRSG
jgi:hypothetical protein